MSRVEKLAEKATESAAHTDESAKAKVFRNKLCSGPSSTTAVVKTEEVLESDSDNAPLMPAKAIKTAATAEAAAAAAPAVAIE